MLTKQVADNEEEIEELDDQRETLYREFSQLKTRFESLMCPPGVLCDYRGSEAIAAHSKRGGEPPEDKFLYQRIVLQTESIAVLANRLDKLESDLKKELAERDNSESP